MQRNEPSRWHERAAPTSDYGTGIRIVSGTNERDGLDYESWTDHDQDGLWGNGWLFLSISVFAGLHMW